MQPRVLNRNDFRAELERWINAAGEALVDIYHPHSGGGGTLYLLTSVSHAEALLQQAEADAVRYGGSPARVTAFRSGYYPLRGTVDEAFIARIRSAWRGDRWYSIAELTTCYPDRLWILGSGNTRQELEAELANLLIENKYHFVGFGEHPFDHDEWIAQDQAETIVTELTNT